LEVSLNLTTLKKNVDNQEAMNCRPYLVTWMTAS
jgi:hypothetical protein